MLLRDGLEHSFAFHLYFIKQPAQLHGNTGNSVTVTTSFQRRIAIAIVGSRDVGQRKSATFGHRDEDLSRLEVGGPSNVNAHAILNKLEVWVDLEARGWILPLQGSN